MFDAIAPRYDFLNHLLSAGIDRGWRRRAIRSLALSGTERVLDLCTGTADLAIAARTARPAAARVVGVDFAGAMLTHGLEKVRRARLESKITLIRGDATALPIDDGSVDRATIGFGIRNVERPERACAELFRVLRPGGRLAILEFGLPIIPAVRPLYLWYFNHILPRIGRAVSRHDAAYSYLPQSVGTFPAGEAFAAVLARAGFLQIESRPLTLGIVYLYRAVRP
jgi:demethylmenaquinone methyltransferase/2-methoxy-6-polyprenyl-1,4-benzoquinol methylase